jgi:DNA polymerase (family 10)
VEDAVTLLGVPERIRSYENGERDEDGRWPLSFARLVAEDLKARLQPACERVEIAGSIRRQRPWVKDVELLCIPKVERAVDLLGETQVEVNHLDRVLEWLLTCDYQEGSTLVSGGLLHKRPDVNGRYAYGPKNKLLVHAPTGLNVDIFTADRRNWGMAPVVRTGSADFNRRVMGRFRRLGMKGHAYAGVTDQHGNDIDCPDEETVFRLLGWPWVPPERRS